MQLTFVKTTWALPALFLTALEASLAQEADRRPAKGVQDNSFLVEEAYNQEAGEVQHIFNFSYDFGCKLETVGEWIEAVDSRGIERDFEAVTSPGVRYAFDREPGQMVLGVAVSIGLTSAVPDYGAILYLSFEHFFQREKGAIQP